MADSDLTVTNPAIGWTGRKRKEAYYTDLSDAEITVQAELDDMITRSGEDPTATVLCVRGGQIKLRLGPEVTSFASTMVQLSQNSEPDDSPTSPTSPDALSTCGDRVSRKQRKKRNREIVQRLLDLVFQATPRQG